MVNNCSTGTGNVSMCIVGKITLCDPIVWHKTKFELGTFSAVKTHC